MRPLDAKELAYDRLGDRFAESISHYDTQRRVQILVDEFLGEELLRERRALDVGCGLGFFSERMQDLGAQVVACDIGPTLVQQTCESIGCHGQVADALDLQSVFGPASFDIVLSSECIEHTPDPYKAIKEMARLIKPGGYLSLSTPNILWWPAVKAASALGIRPFDGLENFSTWSGVRRVLCEEKINVVREHGLHLIPFQIKLNALSTWLDTNCQFLRPFMINICILGQKQADKG